MNARLTRRELVAGTGALAGAAGLLAAWPRRADGPATLPVPAGRGPRKLIDIGPAGVITPGSAQDYRYHANATYFADTRTSWIRMWADWPSLQPDGGYAIDDPRSPGRPHLRALDAQIERACADGLAVVLMPYRYPPWANGTAALAAAPGSDAEIAFQYFDRLSERAWRRRARDGAAYDPPRAALVYRLPDEGHGPESAWGRFFAFLYDRYHYGRRASGRFVRAFELVNEPNLQLWPQQGPPGTDPFAPSAPTVALAVAQMMQTAQAISARHDHSTPLLAPSTSDIDRPGGRRWTPYDAFVTQLLDALAQISYRPHPQQAWSHHNYSDVEQRSAAARTRRVYELLGGRWAGAAQGGLPELYVTEGGARLSRMTQLYPAEDPAAAQARCVAEGWRASAAAGVAMAAQYLLYADPNFDSGLLDPFPSTRRRPAYAAWKAL